MGERNGADDEESDVRLTRDRAAAEEYALVLTSEGIGVAIHHRARTFAVRVSSQDLAAAGRVLSSYEAENPVDARALGAPAEQIRQVDWVVAIAVATALVCFFALTGPANREVAWFASGSADAARILAGEFTRLLTALTLHSDLEHVIANALFGGLFLAAASAGFGPGLAFALALAAGAFGNLANAIFQGPGHLSIGASTAVFGAVGLLAGRSFAHRIRSGRRGLRLWVPVAAGLALMAMLGTGAESDVWAHLFGFVAGVPIGTLAALAIPRAPGMRTQTAIGLFALASLFACWHIALA